MGNNYSIHKTFLSGFEILYIIDNNETKVMLPLKRNDMIDLCSSNSKYVINLEWLKKRSGSDDNTYVLVRTILSSGEATVYAVIPSTTYSAERNSKFKN